MKREELLERLGFHVPESKKICVIVHSDVNNEADDQFAILHHLMTPMFDVRGIIAAHYADQYVPDSLEQSYEELKKLLALSEIHDIAIYRGCGKALMSETDAPESDGVDFIIEEAMREDERPLYILLQGCLTDLAAALNQKPEIASRLTAVWIGGGAYPQGGVEFNLMQDLFAARCVFDSPIPLWQIPVNAYNEVEVTFAELSQKVRPCGKIGQYLFEHLIEMNDRLSIYQGIGRMGENWCLGDQPTAFILMYNEDCRLYHEERAPWIRDDYSYEMRSEGKTVRVYDHIDVRFLMDDFYAKLALCYGKESVN